jgi:hypothetical protein
MLRTETPGFEVAVAIFMAIIAVPLGMVLGFAYAVSIIVMCMQELGTALTNWLMSPFRAA